MSHGTPSTVARCEMLILVWLIARAPAISIAVPPRKCRILTPRSEASLLTRMNSSAAPWNQVAIMTPSSCQTPRKRSQSPASRHTTQFSTTSRIVRRSIQFPSIAILRRGWPRRNVLDAQLARRRSDRTPGDEPITPLGLGTIQGGVGLLDPGVDIDCIGIGLRGTD